MLPYLNTVISILYIYWAFRHAKLFGTYLTAFLSSIYILTNSAFLWTNQDSAGEFGYIIYDEALVLAVIANLIFLFVSVFLTMVFSYFLGYKSEEIFCANIVVKDNVLFFLGIMCIFFELKYIFFGGGLGRLHSLGQVEGRDSLYAMRYDEALAISEGSGLFSSLLSMRILYPIVALGCFFKLIVEKKINFIYLIVPTFISTILMAMSTLQRSPTFNTSMVTVLCCLWAFIAKIYKDKNKLPDISINHLFALLPIVIVGSFIYSFTEQVDVFEGAYHMVERIFLISSFSSTSYYDLFGPGKSLPFAGIGYLFGYPVESNGVEITYREIGQVMNGWPHNLNASFVATAFGACGFTGVAFISVIMILFARIADALVLSAGPLAKLALIVLNIFTAFEISNGPFMNGLYAGLGFNAVLFLFVFKFKKLYK
ncbi:hypothetical protein [Sphaerotilus sp. FB-3]|uniref:hypothetical protein n=1 Tax=Sphaerotilus sp. FB-3 TaxID=2913396 RepID=UPI00203ED31C|nr:hypothetical protein [Sphaerotilus sp. FB-3]